MDKFIALKEGNDDLNSKTHSIKCGWEACKAHNF